MLKEVWSGGQDGADIAGLRAAVAVGLATGGWMPKGWRTISGPRPEYEGLYGLRETASAEYPERTRLNVEGTDFTLICGDRLFSVGTQLTGKECRKAGKPYCMVAVAQMSNPAVTADTCTLLRHNNVRRLNIAGNRDADEQIVEAWLRRVFAAAKEAGEP